LPQSRAKLQLAVPPSRSLAARGSHSGAPLHVVHPDADYSPLIIDRPLTHAEIAVRCPRRRGQNHPEVRANDPSGPASRRPAHRGVGRFIRIGRAQGTAKARYQRIWLLNTGERQHWSGHVVNDQVPPSQRSAGTYRRGRSPALIPDWNKVTHRTPHPGRNLLYSGKPQANVRFQKPVCDLRSGIFEAALLRVRCRGPGAASGLTDNLTRPGRRPSPRTGRPGPDAQHRTASCDAGAARPEPTSGLMTALPRRCEA